ncbi:MAG: NAD(P)H-dependent oxidoreductase subunit E [Anaerolineales bacterium]|nr:NAD(P)H-dependent oxidoreductase subunit E [Anaerolineales bacterium]
MTTRSLDLGELKPILEKYAPDGRSQLLPVLWAAQNIYGYLSEPVVVAIGNALRVPLADIYGVIEFYTMFYKEPVGNTIIRICVSPICAQKGGERILDMVCDHFDVQPNGTTSDGKYTVEVVECLGLCDTAPSALVGDVPISVDALADTPPQGWVLSPKATPLGFLEGEPRWLLGSCGHVTPASVQEYEACGGFLGLKKTLQNPPNVVNEEITQSGLLGRGGAAFPTGLKWKFASQVEGQPKYLVCNADESEPGTFKDRVLLEGYPLSLIEGMLIAAYAVGCSQGYLYIRGEYMRAQAIVQAALENARQAGYLGRNILGKGFDFDIELRSGAGAYVCGEETALFESIEGKRGFPRLKPPYPTDSGLFGKPTDIDNVETLCAAAWIMANGADAFRSVGTEKSAGTKIFCVSGDVLAPGVYEMPLGITLGELIAKAGGVQGELGAVLIGGAAGTFAGPDDLDLSLSFEGLADNKYFLGSGVINVINTERDMRAILYSLVHFFAHESCGKCFPCQLGTQRQLEIMEKNIYGKATQADLAALGDVGFAMAQTSICGVGQMASTAILSALEKWPDVFYSS